MLRLTVFSKACLCALVFLITAGLFTSAQQDIPASKIEVIEVAPGELANITLISEVDSHYVLERSINLQAPWTPVVMKLGTGESLSLTHRLEEDMPTMFYRVGITPNDDPSDTDADGIHDFYELLNRRVLNPLDANDAGLDPDGNGKSYLEEFQNLSDSVTTLSISPADGETGVATTRETVVRLSQPLLPGVTITSQTFYAQFGGEKIPARIHLSETRDILTLFYEDDLPPNARIQVRLNGDVLRDPLNRGVDADNDGRPGGMGEFDFTTLTVTTLPGTAVFGTVYASQLALPANGNDPVNCPLANVKITVDGAEDTLFTFTDSMGNFRLDPAPVGRFFVHIDGRTTTSEVPPGAYYPFVGKTWESRPGAETEVGIVHLPLIGAGTLNEVSNLVETRVTFPTAVTEDFPELMGTELMVPAGSLMSEDGSRGGRVGIAPVAPDRLPGTLPDDLNFPLVITVQTDGPSNFDEPVPVRFPNLPDPETGETLPPGAKTGLWSFDHDKGRFEVVGSMTISPDGLWAVSDPGVGILAPGWHGTNPGSSGGGGDGGDGNCKRPTGCDPNIMCCPPPKEGEGAAGMTDPIDIATGEFYETEVDLVIKGRGMDFQWQRTYRSRQGSLTTMGHNWEHSYNINVKKSGRLMMLRSGKGYEDPLFKDENGNFCRREYFAELSEDDDGKCEMSFGNRDQWVFQEPDPETGVCNIETMTDRNGNTMTFSYDAGDQLIKITDTLGRDIDIAYNADGFVESVTDFTGREVLYEYYQDGDEGGSFGDLKSVSRPAVTDTPHGNNFPAGKTRTYTYTKGHPDERLNHNLLTMTDGRRNDPNDPTFETGPYLVNVYSDKTDELDTSFDHVVRQNWGGQWIDLTYESIASESDERDAPVSRTIINDRMGNVHEYVFNGLFHQISQRVYTGRAIPDQPTTATANRPTGKLRDSDPDFFETRWTYNEDSQPKKTIHPNGNFEERVYHSDLDPNASVTTRGNLRFLIKNPGTHTPAGDQATLMEEFEYLDEFGCVSCGTNFVSRHIDAQGGVTMSEYDDKGNLTKRTHRISSIVEDFEYNERGQMTSHTHPDNGSGHRRRDEFTYYPDTTYLATQVIDATGFAYTTTHEYDALGRKIRTVDPRGFDSLYTYNQLDQVVESFSPEAAAAPTGDNSGVRYATRTFYDANDNVIRRDVENRGEDGAVDGDNPWFTTTYEYEILNEIVRSTQEVDPVKNIVMEYEYDANRNQTLTRFGEATNGTQVANTLTRSYDERNLVFLETRAAGHPDASTRRYDYDANRNLVANTHGLEAGGHTTVFEYDSYDRRVSKTDPMGNVCQYSYDSNSNMTRDLCLGELEDVPGGANNIRLADTTWTYDAMDRRVVENRAHFKHDENGAEVQIADGQGTTTTVWSAFSQVLTTTNDNNHSTNYVYDTANRLLRTIDAKSNTVQYLYDGNNNRVSMLETDKSDLGNPDQQFTTVFNFDGLNRMTATVDNIGNTNRVFYDSRSNRVSTVDAKGNRIEYRYDGLNRLLETDRFMTDTGDGEGEVIDHIITKQYWDDSSRLVGQEDDNGNRTTYEFDALNRKVADVYADATRWTYRYNVYDAEIHRRDANGSVVISQHDLNNRVTRKDVTVGPGVSDDTTFEIYKYDGRSRTNLGQDDDSLVRLSFDSFSNVLRDQQDEALVEAAYDALGNILTVKYFTGDYYYYSYDNNERLVSITKQNTSVANFSYIGHRVENRIVGNGISTDFEYNSATEVTDNSGNGVKDVISMKYFSRDGDELASYSGKRDPGSNKVLQEIFFQGEVLQKSEIGYDSANRMIGLKVDCDNEAQRTKETSLDGVGNRMIVTDQAVTTYQLDVTDALRNRYSGSGSYQYYYDSNSNLLKVDLLDEVLIGYSYDYSNRLISNKKNGGLTDFGYDVFGRRIRVNKRDGESLRILYLNMRCVGEHSELRSRALVFGEMLDELICQDDGSGEISYFLDLPDLSILGVSNTVGDIEEVYTYGDFGKRSIFGPDLFERQSSIYSNRFGYVGREHGDGGLVFMRMRVMDSSLGRFLTPDPLGVWGDIRSLGNAYTYGANSPFNFFDPLGLECSISGRLSNDTDFSSIGLRRYWLSGDGFGEFSGTWWWPKMGLVTFNIEYGGTISGTLICAKNCPPCEKQKWSVGVSHTGSATFSMTKKISLIPRIPVYTVTYMVGGAMIDSALLAVQISEWIDEYGPYWKIASKARIKKGLLKKIGDPNTYCKFGISN